MRIVLGSLLLFFLWPPGQDRVAVNPKIASVEFENSRVRIVRMRFAPHERLVLDYHPAQLVVHLTPSLLEVHDSDGAAHEIQGPPESVFWEEPSIHTVDNPGNAPVEAIEIEFKNASAPSAPVPAPLASPAQHSPDDILPLLREPHHKWKFQNQYVRVTEATLAPGESTYFHTHAYDNIAVETNHATIQRQLFGKEWDPPVEVRPGEVHYTLGDKQPYTHRVKNVGKTVFRVIDIEICTNSSFGGTWEGHMNNLPGIDLNINEAGGKISGNITFYFQERSDPNGPWHIQGEDRTPLLAPRVEGKALTFEVQHHKCHGCAELGPNVKFRMELTGPNEALLWNLGQQEASKNPGPGLQLVRTNRSALSGAPSNH